MAKNHIKRLATPKTWPIRRKKEKFITRPNPGSHKMLFGMPLTTVMTELIKCAKTKKEVKSILKNKNILVDGRKKNDDKYFVGIMSTISIKDTNEFYRITLNNKGKITVLRIDEKEAAIKPCKITGKSVLKKGLVQLNLIDGRNIICKKDSYKVGDTIILSLPKQEIKEHLKLENGMMAYLIGGKHIGDVGLIEAIEGLKIKIKLGKGIYETAKRYAFVIGKDKPLIIIAENKK